MVSSMKTRSQKSLLPSPIPQVYITRAIAKKQEEQEIQEAAMILLSLRDVRKNTKRTSDYSKQR